MMTAGGGADGRCLMKIGSQTVLAGATAWSRVLAAMLALGWAPNVVVSQEHPEHTQNIMAGSRVFGAKGCSTCHAVNGVGGGVGPDLGSAPMPQSFDGFAAAMWNHLPKMLGRMRELGIERPQLSPWEAGDLIAFLFWVDYFEPAGDKEAGKRLFDEKGCSVCHQVAGLGGVYGPNLDFLTQYGSPIQIAAAMWNHGPAMTEAMEARGLRRPTFTGSELSDLIAYLETAIPGLPSEPMYVLPGRSDIGRRYFDERGCRTCHMVRGEGGRIGPPLGRQTGRQNLLEFAAAMWNKEPEMLRAVRSQGMSVPQLRADEMADLVGYLYSVEYLGQGGSVARGRGLLRTKRCLICHSLRGSGGTTARDLAQARALVSREAVIAALWNHAGLLAPDEARPWPTFTESEMADLSTLLQSLGHNR